MNVKRLVPVVFVLGVSWNLNAMLFPRYDRCDATAVTNFLTLQSVPESTKEIIINANQLPFLFESRIDMQALEICVKNCEDWSELTALSRLPKGRCLSVYHNGTATDLNGFPVLDAFSKINIKSDSLLNFTRMPQLNNLEVSRICCRNLGSLDGMENAENLKSIDLYGGFNLSDFRALGNLKNLSISNSNCENYNELLRVQSLERLQICNSKRSGNLPFASEGFGNLSNLRSLHLIDNNGISMIGLAKFAPNLEELDIWEPLLPKIGIVHFFEEAKSKGLLRGLKAVSINNFAFRKRSWRGDNVLRSCFTEDEIENLSKILALPVVDKTTLMFGRGIPSWEL